MENKPPAISAGVTSPYIGGTFTEAREVSAKDIPIYISFFVLYHSLGRFLRSRIYASQRTRYSNQSKHSTRPKRPKIVIEHNTSQHQLCSTRGTSIVTTPFRVYALQSSVLRFAVSRVFAVGFAFGESSAAEWQRESLIFNRNCSLQKKN